MPARLVPLVSGEVYHVLNRGAGGIPVFKNQSDHRRFTETLRYYRHTKTPVRFSKLLELPKNERQKMVSNLERFPKLNVEIIAYCLMPNHFHLLLKQDRDDGISNFIRLATNSYVRYFNTKYRRKGPLLEGRFEAIRVETEEQLLHLSRYIHLNPYTAHLVKDRRTLLAYPFSSLPGYLNPTKQTFCQREFILNYFKRVQDYKNFILDQADYQKTLKLIEHQTLE